jgi:hypothetical protein
MGLLAELFTHTKEHAHTFIATSVRLAHSGHLVRSSTSFGIGPGQQVYGRAIYTEGLVRRFVKLPTGIDVVRTKHVFVAIAGKKA